MKHWLLIPLTMVIKGYEWLLIPITNSYVNYFWLTAMVYTLVN
jgi:hypothetical protein